MARPWESALHVDPTCLDRHLYSTGNFIGLLIDWLPGSECLTQTSPSISESSPTQTFPFYRFTNSGIILRFFKKTLCVYVLFLSLILCEWFRIFKILGCPWVFKILVFVLMFKIRPAIGLAAGCYASLSIRCSLSSIRCLLESVLLFQTSPWADHSGSLFRHCPVISTTPVAPLFIVRSSS